MYVPSPTSRSRKKIYLSVWDLLWAVVSPPLALYLRDPTIVFEHDWSMIAYYWSLATAFALLAFFALRLHDGMTRYFSVHQALDVAEAVLFAELMTFLALFTLTRLDGVPRSIPIVHGLLLLMGLLAARIFMRFVSTEDDVTVHYGSRRERIIVIGANPLASGFIRLLEAFMPQRQTVIAVLDASSDMAGKAISGVRVLGAPHELEGIISEFVVHGINTDRVVIAGEANVLSPAVLQEIETGLHKAPHSLVVSAPDAGLYGGDSAAFGSGSGHSVDELRSCIVVFSAETMHGCGRIRRACCAAVACSRPSSLDGVF